MKNKFFYTSLLIFTVTCTAIPQVNAATKKVTQSAPKKEIQCNPGFFPTSSACMSACAPYCQDKGKTGICPLAEGPPCNFGCSCVW